VDLLRLGMSIHKLGVSEHLERICRTIVLYPIHQSGPSSHIHGELPQTVAFVIHLRQHDLKSSEVDEGKELNRVSRNMLRAWNSLEKLTSISGYL
jgi:rRNA pseudouridine-1189 N-methylase Emg1 (Nep1/Mra1 family)